MPTIQLVTIYKQLANRKCRNRQQEYLAERIERMERGHQRAASEDDDRRFDQRGLEAGRTVGDDPRNQRTDHQPDTEDGCDQPDQGSGPAGGKVPAKRQGQRRDSGKRAVEEHRAAIAAPDPPTRGRTMPPAWST